jgi:hypothetical protein
MKREANAVPFSLVEFLTLQMILPRLSSKTYPWYYFTLILQNVKVCKSPHLHLISPSRAPKLHKLTLVKRLGLVLIWLLASALAQVDYVLVPSGLVRQTPEAIIIRIPKGGELSFVPGIGWFPSISQEQPVFVGDEVYVSVEVATYLGLATNNTIPLSQPSSPLPSTQPQPSTQPEPTASLPSLPEPTPETPTPQPTLQDTTGPARITDVRFGGTGSIRVVFDLAGQVDRAALERSVTQVWRRHWQRILLFNYPVEIRKAIYTTNVIESLNYSLKKVVKTRGAFPDEDSLFKVLYLAIKNVQKKWTMPIRDWRRALNWFATLFGDSLTNRLDTRIS